MGLALSYAVTLMGMFQWGVRQSAEVENMVRCLYSRTRSFPRRLSSVSPVSVCPLSSDDVCGESGGVQRAGERGTLGNSEASAFRLAEQRPGDL